MQINVKCIVKGCNILVLKDNEMTDTNGNKVVWKSCSFIQNDNICQDITVDKEVYPLLSMGAVEDLIIDFSGERKTGFQTCKAKIVGIDKKSSPNK